jgi:type IV secretion system protein TrbF
MNPIKKLFSKREQRKGDSPDNPFLNARKVWNTHEGSVIAAGQIWQVIGILSLLIALAAVGGMTYIGSQSKFIPYIVEVDKHGESFAINVATESSPVDRRAVLASVADFIRNARLVTPDISVQRRAIFKLYGMLEQRNPATMKMNTWLNSNEKSTPFYRATIETVDISIEAVLPQSNETWQVDWIEHVYNRDGTPKHEPFRMRALLTVYILPTSNQTSEKEIQENPLRIFIRDFSWTKQI